MTWAKPADFVEIPWQTPPSPLHWEKFLHPANRSSGAMHFHGLSSMNTPKPSTGPGRAKKVSAPDPPLAPRLDCPPQRWPEKALESRVIKIRGAREHNLKNIDLT